MTVTVNVLEFFGYFALWTGVLYCMHRLAHQVPWMWTLHRRHHHQIYDGSFEFSPWNLIGFYNDWPSTADQWLTEIGPSILFVILMPQSWPILVIYLIDNIFAEGITDHNPRLSLPLLSMGRYHLRHHTNPKVNFDGFTQLWDWIFRTRQYVR